MVLRLLTMPILGPVYGLSWIGNKVIEQAGSQLDEREDLQKRLLALQLAFDMGEIEEEEFEEQEEEFLLAIQAIDDAERAAEAELEEE